MSFGCPQMAPKVPRAAGNSKKLRKWSKIRNIIKETYFYGVLGMPAHHLTLSELFGCPQTAPKVSHATGNSKKLRKWSKIRNIIGKTYFLRLLCMAAHHLTLLGSFGCPQTAPKVSRAAGNSKNCENSQKIEIY